MTLWLSVYNPDGGVVDEDYEASGSFPELRRLSIGGDTWCADGILAATGPQLTHLSLQVESYREDTLGRLKRLHDLRELTLHRVMCDNMRQHPTDTDAHASHMTALTALHLNFGGAQEDLDFTFLTMFHELRLLRLEQLPHVSDSLVPAVLDLPKLTRLCCSSSRWSGWEGSMSNIGLLSANAAAQRPGLRIAVEEDQTNDQTNYSSDSFEPSLH